MSVVIVGGNECMTRRYKDLCEEYRCKAKIYPKMSNGLKNIGTPDLLILFTNTISHTMVRCTLSEATRTSTTKRRGRCWHPKGMRSSWPRRAV